MPRWVLILGALVPVGGLVWGVVTHFVPKVEPQKPPAPASVAVAAPAPTPVPSVSVSGSGNVGVGAMSGGTINNGGGGNQAMTRAGHLAAVGLLLAALASVGLAGAQTSVSGSNNVGVGQMSGGTIINGFTAEQLQALLKRSMSR